MPVANTQEARDAAAALKGVLRRHGLPIDFKVCIAQLAKRIRDHAHFEQLLTTSEPDFRAEFYEAIRPHLNFKAWPLDKYVASAGQRAEREKLPTLGRDGQFQHFHPAQDVRSVEKHAEEVIASSLAKRTLILVCAKCTREDKYYAVGEETNVDVVLKARREGWIYDFLAKPPVEICPTCPTSLREEELQ